MTALSWRRCLLVRGASTAVGDGPTGPVECYRVEHDPGADLDPWQAWRTDGGPWRLLGAYTSRDDAREACAADWGRG